MTFKSLVIIGLLVAFNHNVLADKDTQDFETMVDQRLAEYAAYYPDIYFLRLKGAPSQALFQQVRNAMGVQPANLDYEHDTDVIELLMSAQWNRLAMMMETQSPSATLYQLGEQATFREPYLCVITLDTDEYEKDPYAATRLMLDLERDAPLTKVSNKEFLDNREFLKFTVDHEAFHCLDVYRNGPLYHKNSTDEQQFHQLLRAEARADMFAALKVLMDNDLGHLIPRLAEVRAIGAREGDCTHHTSPMLHIAMSLDMQKLEQFAQVRRIDLITSLVDEFIPDLTRYSSLTNVDCMNTI